MENPVEQFLINNKFKKVEITTIDDGVKSCFENKKCTVIFRLGYYEVVTFEIGDYFTWYSADLNIYSLIGYLTYYGLMSKNYKII